MAGRGSGIGQGWGSATPNQGGGRAASAATQATYGNAGTVGLGFMGPAKSTLAGTPGWLLLLVAAEAATMVALRHGFRHSHGG